MVDPKGSGGIDEGTWISLFRHLRPSYSKAKVTLLFKILDEDSTYEISILFELWIGLLLIPNKEKLFFFNILLTEYKEFRRIVELLSFHLTYKNIDQNVFSKRCPRFYNSGPIKKFRRAIKSMYVASVIFNYSY